MPHADIFIPIIKGMDRHEKLLDRVSEFYFARERMEEAKKLFYLK